MEGDTNALCRGITQHLKGSTRDFLAKHVLEWTSLPIYFVGIWDAVEALGLPSATSLVTRSFNSYHQTRLPPNVTHAAHALALHELRTDYMPHLWRAKLTHQTLVQRWFLEITVMSAAVTHPENWRTAHSRGCCHRQGRPAYPALIPSSALRTLGVRSRPPYSRCGKLYHFAFYDPGSAKRSFSSARIPKPLSWATRSTLPPLTG